MLDLQTVDPDLHGFVGGFTDARFGYFVPNFNGTRFGKVPRVDLLNFSASGVTVRDLTLTDPDLKGFWGGLTDGRYGCFVPNFNGAAFGKLVCIQLFSGSGSS